MLQYILDGPSFADRKRNSISSHIVYDLCSDSLRAGRSEDRIPVVARFSAPVQIVPGAHPASYTMGTGS